MIINRKVSGGSNFPQITGGCANLFAGKTWTQQEVTLDISGCTNAKRGPVTVQDSDFSETFLDSCGALKKITLDGGGTGVVRNMSSFCETNEYTSRFGTPAEIEEVYFKDCIMQQYECRFAFKDNSYLKKISGSPFNFSNVPGYNSGYWFCDFFKNCSSLEEVRFVPNSILWMATNYQIFNVSQVLSDASLASIANGLAKDSATGNLKLLSTPYARCSTLMGDVDSDDFFTINETSGTTSLADFITNTKGWTLYQ